MQMTRNEAKQELRRSWRSILSRMTIKAKQEVNNEPSYVCPLCGHGKNGDGLTYDPNSKDQNTLKCFGCGFSGDILDLYQKVTGLGFNETMQALCAENGLQIERERPQARFSSKGKETDTPIKETAGRAVFKRGKEYYEYCRENLANSKEAIAYLRSRGISLETALSCGVGYDPAWRSPTSIENGKNPPESKRLIVPTLEWKYIARSIDEPRNEDEKKCQKMNEGKAELFNTACFKDTSDKPIFIVEGFFDALSVMEAGGLAVALNGTSNTGLLVDLLELEMPKKTLVLALDQDKAGRKAQRKLLEGLRRLNIPCILPSIDESIMLDCKDANEALQKDRAQFFVRVDKIQTQTSARPDSVSGYMDSFMVDEISRFQEGSKVKTGFAELDRQSGGLFTGLYVIAAISSLGKTTLAHQIADNLAMSGKDVIYFSLEQSRLELVTKSIARITAEKDLNSAVTALSIRCGNITNKVVEAMQDYRERVKDRISIVEGNFNCTVSYIENYVRNYIYKTGCRPYVFVDYLQILQPDKDERCSTKETVDKTITELKRLSRLLGITVFVICSVNRANYLAPIDFESLKESGAIEYTADNIYGLQLRCLSDDSIFTEANKLTEKREKVKEAKAETPRRIELVCLKNRSGKPTFSCYFDYYAAHDYFVEAKDKKEIRDPWADDDNFTII